MKEINVGQFKNLTKNNQEITFSFTFGDEILDVTCNKFLPIDTKIEVTNAILDMVFSIERDERGNITNYRFEQNFTSQELFFVYSVAKYYIKNMKFPQTKGQDNLVEIYNILVGSDLFYTLKEKIYDITVLEEMLLNKIEAFKKNYIESYDISDLNTRLVRFLTIYENKLEQETKELELKNIQSEKFINMMPENPQDLQLNVEKMTEMAEKLNSLENIEVIKNSMK